MLIKLCDWCGILLLVLVFPDAGAPQAKGEVSPASASDTSPADSKAKLRLGRGAKRPRCRYKEESPPSAKKPCARRVATRGSDSDAETGRVKITSPTFAAETCNMSAVLADKRNPAGLPNLVIPETVPMQFDDDLHYYVEADDASEDPQPKVAVDKATKLSSPPSLSSTPMVSRAPGQRPGAPALSPISEATLHQTKVEDSSSKEQSLAKPEGPVEVFSLESSDTSPPSSPVFNKARGPPPGVRTARQLSSPCLFDEDSVGSTHEHAPDNPDSSVQPAMQPINIDGNGRNTSTADKTVDVSRPSPSMLTGRIGKLKNNSSADISNPSPSLLPPGRPRPALASPSVVPTTRGKKLVQAKLTPDCFQPTKHDLVTIPNFNGGRHGNRSMDAQEEIDYVEAIKRSLEDVNQSLPGPSSTFKKPAQPTTPKHKKPHPSSTLSPRRSPRLKYSTEESLDSESLPDLPSGIQTRGARRDLKLDAGSLNGSIDPGVHLSQYETAAPSEPGFLEAVSLIDLELEDMSHSPPQHSSPGHSPPTSPNSQPTSPQQRKKHQNSRRHKTSPNKASQESTRLRRSPRKLPPPASPTPESLDDVADDISASCSSVVFNSKQTKAQARARRLRKLIDGKEDIPALTETLNWHPSNQENYLKISNMICTKSPNLNVARLVLQSSLPNPVKARC